jgi:hypothetical protein
MPDRPPEETFRALASRYWEELRRADSRAATSATEALEELVASWRAEGVAQRRLNGLLLDPSEEVRYAAAASLGVEDASAVTELRRLARDAKGLVAPTARLLLMKRGVRQ